MRHNSLSSKYISTHFQNSKYWIDQNDRCVENYVINVSICGNNFTLADIMLFCFLHFGTTVGQNIDPELKNINSWFEKVKERPSAAA